MNTPSPRRSWIPSPRVALLSMLALLAAAGAVWTCAWVLPRRAAAAYLDSRGDIKNEIPEWAPAWAKSCRWLFPVDEIFVVNRGPCDLAPLTPFREAHTVELFHCAVDDRGFAPIRKFRRLVRVEIKGTLVTDAGLAALRDCRQLADFSCSATAVSDAGLAHLAGLPLRTVDLQSTAVSGEGLRSFEDAPLTMLMLHQTPITDAGLASVAGLKSLRALGLQSTGITDAGLVHLEGLSIEHLNLIETRVTNAGIARLERLPLASIDLAWTDVTPEVIPILLRMKSLKEVIVGSPPFTEGDVQRLRTAGLIVHVWE